jgi:hypothetical protein
MNYIKVIKSGLLALIPVSIALAIWILLRADSLVNLSKELPAGFFVPTTSGEAIRSGVVIWFAVAFIASFICEGIYWLITRKWHKNAIVYALILVAVAMLISLIAFISGKSYALEASGEILIVAFGFATILPWIAQHGSLSLHN